METPITVKIDAKGAKKALRQISKARQLLTQKILTCCALYREGVRN